MSEAPAFERLLLFVGVVLIGWVSPRYWSKSADRDCSRGNVDRHQIHVAPLTGSNDVCSPTRNSTNLTGNAEMKRMKRTTAFLLALLVALTAQATDKSQLSEALQVARAAGFKKIRDYTSKDAVEFAKRSPGSPAADAVIGVGTAAGVFTPPRGLSSGTAAGLSLAGAFLLSLPVAYPELSPRFLAWMPKDLAATPEAAGEALAQVITRAIAESVAGAQVELKVREVEKKTQLKRYIAIDEPRCKDCKLWMPAIDLGREPKVGEAPNFLGGTEAYFWGRPGWKGEGNFAGYPWTAQDMTRDDRIEVLRSISAKLPAWMYLYVPPDERLAPYPQMFHQGRILLFMEPGVQ